MTLKPSFNGKLAIILASAFILGACSKEPPPPPQQTPVVINVTANKGADVVPGTQTGMNRQVTGAHQTQGPGATPLGSMQGQAFQAGAQAQSAAMVQATRPVYHPGQTRPRAQTNLYEMESLDEASFFNTQIHEMALQLLKNFRGEAGPNGPIAVTTFVDLNKL